MRLLLDTHIALWAVADSQKLPKPARDLILDQRNDIFVSAASLWEIAIKHALKPRGRDGMPINATDARQFFGKAGYHFLAVSAEHACELDALPKLHKDPFDRMLIAQASVEPMRLVTHDKDLIAYGAMVLRV